MPAHSPIATRDLALGPARPEDDAELRRILRENPMEGDISLAMEREPSFFLACDIEGDRHDVRVAREPSGRLAAFCTRSVRTRYVDGRPLRLGYLGQLRLDRPYRARPGLFKEGVREMGALPREGELSWDITSIVADNLAARRMLTAGLPWMPRYRPVADLSSLVMVTRPGLPTPGLWVRKASADLMDDLTLWMDLQQRQYQFACRWDLSRLGDDEPPPDLTGLRPADFLLAVRGDDLVGVVALWDQRPFRQNRVTGYGPRLRRLRPFANLLAPVAGWPRLPRPGRILSQCHLSHFVVLDDHPDVATTLLSAALDEAWRRGFNLAVLGLDARRSLAPLLARTFKARIYGSTVYTVHWHGEEPPPLPETLLHPEVAVL